MGNFTVNDLIVTKHFLERWEKRFPLFDPGDAIDVAVEVPYNSVARASRFTKGRKFVPNGHGRIFLYSREHRSVFVVKFNGAGRPVLVTAMKLKII